MAEQALDELLDEGGLAELTQHDLQTYLWFTLADAPDPRRVAAALATFLEMAELNRYAGIAASPQTGEILRTYDERGRTAGTRAGTRAMDMSGILPPDLPELEWGEIMGTEEIQAYERIAATLELALAAGEIRPGARGWRATQVRLARQQLTMKRPDGPPLLERVTTERLETWAEAGGPARRAMAATIAGDLTREPSPPGDLADRMAPMQWLLEIAAGRNGESPGIPLTVGGNVSRKIVQEAAERFGWWDLPDRAPRTESDIWPLNELRSILQRAGILRRSTRRLLLGTRGRPLLGDPFAQWALATSHLIDAVEFDSAAQEAALMLLLSARGMVEVRELVREVAEILAGSGWRDTGNGAPPDDRDVSRAVWALIRRCELWALVDQGTGPGFTTRLRLTDAGQRGGHSALRWLALRPRPDADS
jgi:hypothetical protein